jgi:cytochrome c oxidase assembly factor CtaG/cytochrome c2
MRLVFDILVVAAMLTSLTLYFRAARFARLYEPIAFSAGWLTIFAALVGPMDTLSDVLFAVHMTQHELLMIVAAPLIVIGRPMIYGLHGLSPSAREKTLAITRSPVVLKTWRAITGPVVVLVVHAIVLWAWHIPFAFEGALHNETIHAVQHLMFFITAALFWWAIIHGRYGRLGYGVAVFFVFATAMHTSILGALLYFAHGLWYPSYHSLEDQQLAGLIMWIPSGVIFIVAGLALFAAWLGESERRAKASSFTTLLMLLLCACANEYRGDRIAEARQLTGGEPEHGKTAIQRYGCGACHTIPGVDGAVATVGPPLDQIGVRTYLAGHLINTPTNLMKWIRAPQSIDPKSAMPDLFVTEHDGRDIAAYLYTLK